MIVLPACLGENGSVAKPELAIYKFDARNKDTPAAGLVRDLSGHGLHLTIHGSPLFSSGADNKSGGARMDGAHDYFSQKSTQFHINGDLTIFMVFSRASSGYDKGLISWTAPGDDLQSNAAYTLQIRPSGDLVYIHETGEGSSSDYGQNNFEATGTSPVGIGWHTLTLQRKASDQLVVARVDGQEVLRANYPRGPDGGSSDTFSIGWDSAHDTTNLFQGTMYGCAFGTPT